MDVKVNLMSDQDSNDFHPEKYEYFETGRMACDDSYEAGEKSAP